MQDQTAPRTPLRRGRHSGRTFLVTVPVVLLAAVLSVAAGSPEWAGKVDPRVLEQVRDGNTEFLILLGEQADLEPAAHLGSKSARGAFVYEELKRTSKRTQAGLIEWLETHDVEYRSYWIANMLWVRGDRRVLEELSSRPEVERVDANPTVQFEGPIELPSSSATRAIAAVEWNVAKILADQAWDLGYTGVGVVIGGQDTGYDWDHPALIRQYRGWDGTTADHDYNWHDSVHIGLGPCGSDAVEPCDDHNHGTHTMGTMVGDDGGANRIGVSPGARWIGCRNMNQGAGTPATYIECFQWFVAPTDLNDENPDPSKAPHVINNSWTCPPDEGCSAGTLRIVVANTRAAGIVVVASAGNDGGGCGSVDNPPAIYDDAFSVAATNSSDSVAGFSSRGPVVVDGSDRLKPDISAPGVGVRSSIRGGGYQSLSGTSMAGPHVAAAVALLLDARPDLIGDVDAIETLMTTSATPLTTGQMCGTVLGTEIPNNTYGHGLLNASNLLLGDADADGTDNLGDCAPTDAALWRPPAPVIDLRLDAGAATEISWSAPPQAGATEVRFDLLRSSLAGDFTAATCLTADSAVPGGSDPDAPAEAFYYLVRVENDCGENPGADGSGLVRSAVASCP